TNQGRRPFRRPRLLATAQTRKGYALDVGHDEVVDTADLTDIVDRAYVRMLEASRCARFPMKAFDHGRVVRLAEVRDLEGHGAGEEGIFGEVDCPHAALTQLPQEAVATKLGRQNRVGHFANSPVRAWLG